MRIYDSMEPSGPVMGKADKYYTLWMVESPYKTTWWYGTQTVQNFNYLQNLSMDKDSAIEKMKEKFGEDFRVDEDLRSTHSYKKELSPVEYKDDIFLFGKYKKQKFSDVNDVSYKTWYYDQVKGTEKDSDVLKSQLSEVLIEFDGETIWIDELEKKAMRLFEENFRKRGHLGTNGETYTTWARLRDVRLVNTSFGGMVIYELVDQDGNLIFYKGSKELDVEKDQIIKLSGKVKHEQYYSSYYGKTVQETSLKYPKILQK